METDGYFGVTVPMIAAAMIVAASGVFLVLQAAVIAFAPRRAERFLEKFASSLRAHLTEQGARLVAGAGFVLYARQMRFPMIFEAFGWVVIVTSAGLLLIPWRWHNRFARWAIPMVIRHLKLYGVGSGALGMFVLVSMF